VRLFELAWACRLLNYVRDPGETTGEHIPVDLSRMVAAVYVGPTMPDWFVDVVRAVADRFGLEAPVLRSSLAAAPDFGHAVVEQALAQGARRHRLSTRPEPDADPG
jgi:hypothetical protein